MAEPRLIRQSIHQWLVSLGASPQSRPHEALLIRDGNYRGHRFQRDGFEAVWFVEENEIKFFAPRVGLLETISVEALVDRQLPSRGRIAA